MRNFLHLVALLGFSKVIRTLRKACRNIILFFTVLSYSFNEHVPSAWFWMIVDAFNCLHGVLIFFVLIISRQKIKKELSGKIILGYVCPAKWANVDDEEEVCLDNEGNQP